MSEYGEDLHSGHAHSPASFSQPRFWITSGLLTTLKVASPVNTSAFVGTNPTSERITSGLPVFPPRS